MHDSRPSYSLSQLASMLSHKASLFSSNQVLYRPSIPLSSSNLSFLLSKPALFLLTADLIS
jgi:hypothetical protein